MESFGPEATIVGFVDRRRGKFLLRWSLVLLRAELIELLVQAIDPLSDRSHGSVNVPKQLCLPLQRRNRLRIQVV
ncbi:MAG: hypothetical protein KF912_14905 [Phycisphaeraceae bacterium]|nr:hypothetical protein [Phycisphaeraceae bacterium]